MLKSLILLSLLINGSGYSQSLIFNSDIKDSIGLNSVFYSVLESKDLGPSCPNNLNTTYSIESKMDESVHSTNNALQYNSTTRKFLIPCGTYANQNLMVHVSIMKDSELIEEIYHQ